MVVEDSETVVENSETLPQSYFETLDYEHDLVQWDLFGQPQPCVRHAALTGAFGATGTVILDCGCGAGDNANFLASLGYDVIGFDVSGSAIATARERSSASDKLRGDELRGKVDFVQTSAMTLEDAAMKDRASEIGGFEVALDSALIHCLDDDAQRAYVDGLRTLMKPGGSLYVGCFSDGNPDPWQNPRRISEARLRTLLASQHGWSLTELREVWWARPSKSGGSGGAWTRAWWVRAEACASSDVSVDPKPSSVEKAGPIRYPARPDTLRPLQEYRYRVDGWRATAAAMLAAVGTWTRPPQLSGGAGDEGELIFLWAQAESDPRLPEPIRRLATRRRLICAWRAAEEEPGVCFGVGGERMWGEAFFLLDRETTRARSSFASPR